MKSRRTVAVGKRRKGEEGGGRGEDEEEEKEEEVHKSRPPSRITRPLLGWLRNRARSASNVTVITRNLPRKLRVGKIENYP